MNQTLCFLLIPLSLSLAQVYPSKTLAQDIQRFSRPIDYSTQPNPLSIRPLRYGFKPHLIKSDRLESILFELILSGSPTAVTFEMDSLENPMYDDGTNGDVLAGDNVYIITLSAEQITSRLTESDVFRPFIGFVNIYEGTNRTWRLNAFAEIWTPAISPVSIQQLVPDIQVSPYLFNIKSNIAPTGDDFDSGPLAQKFYQWFGDDYDFLHFLLIPGFGGNRYHRSVQNSTKGLGIDIFNNSAAFGSSGRLQGINVYPISIFFTIDNGYNHEIGHQWMNYLEDTPLAVSIPHWPYSSIASGVMGINIGQTRVGGTFSLTVTPQGDGYFVGGGTVNEYGFLPAPEFNSLELYLMGLQPKDSVTTILIFKDQNKRPVYGFYPDSAFIKVSIGEVINGVGERVPSYDNAQRDFGIATIVVSDELLSPEEMAFYEYFARQAEAKTPVPASSGFWKAMGKPFYVATGGRATVALGLEAPTENTPPIVVNAIENTELVLGGESMVRNLNTVFSDVNGDVLTYSASSSNENVASVTILEDTLKVIAVGVGTTTITVAADDANGGAMWNIFVVSVDINSAPIVTNAIDDIELLAGDDVFTRDLTTVFSDPDGDALNFSASSSDEAIATVFVLNDIITVTPIAAGTATITVTADDGRGGSAEASFNVNIVSNTAPVVTNAIENIEIMVGGGDFTRDLSSVFSDPDGDALDFSASSSDEAVATATVSDSLLTVTAIAVGTATITITADDGRGGSASTAFTVNIPTIVSVERLNDELPKNFALYQNYPNPFNPVTMITFDLPQPSNVVLTIYDVLGRQVVVLASGDYPIGSFMATWDATGLSSGTYVYQLKAGPYIKTRKLLLLK